MRRAKCVALLLVTAALGGGCATNTAPRDFLLTPREARSIALGGWMELDLTPVDSAGGGGARGGRRARGERVEGELLAVTADTVWVLTEQGGGRAIPTAAVSSGKLTGYKGQKSAIAGYTLLGVVSTLSNGLLLIITTPLWIIVGTSAASHESNVPQRLVPDRGHTWEQLALFARFPQGMPERWPER